MKKIEVDVYKNPNRGGIYLEITDRDKSCTLTSRYFASGIVRFKGTSRILEYEEKTDSEPFV